MIRTRHPLVGLGGERSGTFHTMNRKHTLSWKQLEEEKGGRYGRRTVNQKDGGK